jgi:phosphomevalonate kinase
MKAQAPGKLVISGAYAVLEGAASVVTAVNRYAVADTERQADFVSPELREALGDKPAPHVDVSALRENDRKLGIGSSAAIVVAGIGALRFAEGREDLEAIRKEVFEVARAAHRKVQGGGSGIDVAASSFGGTLHCRMNGGMLQVRQATLPLGICVRVHVANNAASTPQMIAKVKQLKAAEPQVYARIMSSLRDAAEETASATKPQHFVRALRKQAVLLSELGDCASIPIFPIALRPLADEAFVDEVVVIPSGAGGGDITICVGTRDGCEAWQERIEATGQRRIELQIGALGLHPAGESRDSSMSHQSE